MVKYKSIYIKFKQYSKCHISAAWCTRFVTAYRKKEKKENSDDITFSCRTSGYFQLMPSASLHDLHICIVGPES